MRLCILFPLRCQTTAFLYALDTAFLRYQHYRFYLSDCVKDSQPPPQWIDNLRKLPRACQGTRTKTVSHIDVENESIDVTGGEDPEFNKIVLFCVYHKDAQFSDVHPYLYCETLSLKSSKCTFNAVHISPLFIHQSRRSRTTTHPPPGNKQDMPAEPRITPRNLSYNTSLPPFLQRLHNSNASSGLDGRHEFAVARPKRARNPDADEEDEPAYVDEGTGEVISREEYAALVSSEGKRDDAEERDVGQGGVESGDKAAEAGKQTKSLKENEKEKEKENLAAIGGGPRKRKAVKVIGSAESEDEDAKEKSDSKPKPDSTPGGAKKGASGSASKQGKKGKGKKIKLSFGDDEG